jgi:4-azaleucine resistance transporter AzlC
MILRKKQEQSARHEFSAGARDTFPLLLGAFPFGLIYGTLAVSSGLSAKAALAMSAFVFAGSAQFIAVGLIAAGTPVSIIIVTTFVVNLRHLLYSAALLPELRNLSQGWRFILAFFLTDETFAVSAGRYRSKDGSDHKHWYQLGSSIIMYLNWQFWCAAGLLLGSRIPDAQAWGLDVAMIVTFIGMTIPYIRTKPMAVTVLTAGILSLLTWQLPYNLGLIIAALSGVLAGTTTEKVISMKKPAQEGTS